ncbi:MAG TPA: hypothetical protein VFG39_02535 [Balneolaceae bacterium]|nr:hypothetical protein [Balneolaceae bacterium]
MGSIGMANREITQEEVKNLIEDASYLQDEAEALRYVIDGVPYDVNPPGSKSIVEMLLLIDHAQLSYYRPILEETIASRRAVHLEDFTHFEKSFEVDEEKKGDIQKVLAKIAKHRAGVVNVIKNITLINWEKEVHSNEEKTSLLHFMQGMIRFERGILKEIAERVMVYNQDKQTQREIEKRRAQQKGQQFTENK